MAATTSFLVKSLFFLIIAVSSSSSSNYQHHRHQQEEEQVPERPPDFDDVAYKVSGVLRIPYAEIVEPFDCYHDPANSRSRIDYYNGMTKTVYFAGSGNYTADSREEPAEDKDEGSKENVDDEDEDYDDDDYDNDDDDDDDFGFAVTVFFMTTEKVRNQQTCLIANGTSDTPIKVQGMIPNLTDFQYSGEGRWAGVDCIKWQSLVVNGDKENKYTFWISKANGTPVHYEMMGYDTLLTSHYDKYEIDYHGYAASADEHLDDELFDLESDLLCKSVADAGPQDVQLHSPMMEFVHNHDGHVNEAFEKFKRQHAVTYEHHREHEKRRNVFRHNHRYVHSMNRAGLGYKLAVNRFSDRTDDELAHRHRTGLKRLASGSSNRGRPFHKHKYTRRGKIPRRLDWRIYGAVNPVKDQAVCGSCWSFSAAGVVEGAIFLKTGKLRSVSEQALVDCTWGYGNDGCDGGNEFKAYEWIEKHGGIPTDDSYGPYLGSDGRCHDDENSTRVGSLVGYVNVTSGDADALKIALATKGPVAVSFDASLKDFAFYSNGIYYNPECKNDSESLDHSVLAVGYGELDGEPYWLVQNSWSTYWGNDGYFLISQRDNMCGITTAPTYVILK